MTGETRDNGPIIHLHVSRMAKRAKSPQIAEKVDTRHRMRYNAGMERFKAWWKREQIWTAVIVIASLVLVFVWSLRPSPMTEGEYNEYRGSRGR